MSVKVTCRDDFSIIKISNPPVNALGASVRSGIWKALDEIEENESIASVLIIGEGRFFSAGADIKEFGLKKAEPFLPDLISRIENFSKPVFAAINGTALGGGLELALGCRARFAVPDVKLGLPEVNLGLIPGAGGTQRLPRLVGVMNAANMICYGKPIDAAKGERMGLIDKIILKDNFVTETLKYIHDNEIDLNRHNFGIDNIDKTNINEDIKALKSRLSQKFKGQKSPLVALEAVASSLDGDFQKGLKTERTLFKSCMESEQRKALIHAYNVERTARNSAKLPAVNSDHIQDIAIIGAGTMGTGIALAFAAPGFNVKLYDVNSDSLAKAEKKITHILAQNVKKRRISQSDSRETAARIECVKELDDLANCDLAIEAVIEKMDVKKAVFKQLDLILKPEALLATNTSYLDINEIALATRRRDQVIGMHFFSPANIMKLVEVVRTDYSSAEALAKAMSLCRKIGKNAIICGVGDGFIGNRIFKRYRKQAEYLIEDGALPEQVDAAMKKFGFAMGPFEVSDLAGLDISWLTRRREDTTRPKEERYVNIADKLYERRRLGQKSGKGWYRYNSGERSPMSDPVVHKIIEESSTEKSIIRRHFEDEEIQDRILLAMINEAAKILEEGIASHPSDIDLVYLFGYGFPRYRGGPIYYADQMGVEYISQRISTLAKTDSYTWAQPALLKAISNSGLGFHTYFNEMKNVEAS